MHAGSTTSTGMTNVHVKPPDVFAMTSYVIQMKLPAWGLLAVQSSAVNINLQAVTIKR
jgi:hypothetical protein